MHQRSLNHFSHNTYRQLFKYGMVGLTQNGLGFLLYLTLTHLGIDPKIAITVLYPFAVSIGYFGNKQWTFAYKGKLFKSGIKYIIAYICGYILNLLILRIFVDKLHYPHLIVQAVTVFVVAAFLFLSFKFLVFGEIKIPNISKKN